jgi:hypothetical protein
MGNDQGGGGGITPAPWGIVERNGTMYDYKPGTVAIELAGKVIEDYTTNDIRSSILAAQMIQVDYDQAGNPDRYFRHVYNDKGDLVFSTDPDRNPRKPTP